MTGEWGPGDRQWWQWRWQLWELTIYEGPLPEASLLPGLAGNS